MAIILFDRCKEGIKMSDKDKELKENIIDKDKEQEERHHMKDPTYPFLSHKLPPTLNEVAYVIAKVYKYGNIDDYAEKLIREDIEKRINSSSDDGIVEDSFKEYLKKYCLPLPLLLLLMTITR